MNECPKCKEMVGAGAHTCQPVVKNETITEEQAVELVKFAGLWFSPADSYVGQDHWGLDEGDEVDLERDELIDWLYSPQGQSAVMDKLGEIKVYAINQYPPLQFDYHACKIVPKRSTENHAIGRGKTRPHALLLAVLAMIKEGK